MAAGPGGQSPINVTHHLKGIHFPAEKRDLVEQAKKNGAPSEVTEAIEAMPEETYETMADVMKGFKQAEYAPPTGGATWTPSGHGAGRRFPGRWALRLLPGSAAAAAPPPGCAGPRPA